jgi:hypothetical protein
LCDRVKNEVAVLTNANENMERRLLLKMEGHGQEIKNGKAIAEMQSLRMDKQQKDQQDY